jgi:hypothetical protein
VLEFSTLIGDSPLKYLCNHHHNLQDKLIVLILKFLLPTATQSLSEKNNPIFYRELQTLLKINQGQIDILTKVLKLMLCGMCNEDGRAEKHRQYAQQQCRSEKCKLICVKRNNGSFPDFYTAQLHKLIYVKRNDGSFPDF